MFGGFDHAGVLGQRNEGAGESADIARRHGAAFLHRVVEQRQRRGRAMGADAVEPDLFQDARHAVAFGRRRREREVDDAEGHAQARGGGAPDQFAGARDLERGAADDRRERAEIDVARGLDRAQHHARSADADIDRAFRLACAVKRAGHERVVLDRVAEHHELGAADRALRRRSARPRA